MNLIPQSLLMGKILIPLLVFLLVVWLAVCLLLLFSMRRTLASFSRFIYSLEEKELIEWPTCNRLGMIAQPLPYLSPMGPACLQKVCIQVCCQAGGYLSQKSLPLRRKANDFPVLPETGWVDTSDSRMQY